jgi:extradiol dioxygenase family protein
LSRSLWSFSDFFGNFLTSHPVAQFSDASKDRAVAANMAMLKQAGIILRLKDEEDKWVKAQEGCHS